jgi:hypothetical protein
MLAEVIFSVLILLDVVLLIRSIRNELPIARVIHALGDRFRSGLKPVIR